jgi:NTE family protein
MIRGYVAIIFFLLVISFQGFAQESKRPKIGLALSGGGAKGLAHIGIIEVMEEVGLTPDYITGTSMGSLVGALYAIGYSSEDMKKVVSELNWDEVLANRISFERVAIEEKAYYGRYIAELSLENKKFNLPKGVIEGQELSLLFSRLTRGVHGIEDFHKFPIPFECIASDVATGEIVVLDHGSLPDAMRASMAIPSLFTPVEIDDHYLVDGGLLRNFPVQNVIDMGADIVIGVYVSDDLYPKEELNSMVDILTQSAFIMSVFDSRRQKLATDIYIEPDLKGYGTTSFSKADSIIDRGRKAGNSVRDQLRNLSDSLNRLGEAKIVKRYDAPGMYLISDVETEGNNVISERIIERKLRLPSEDSISINEIENRIRLSDGSRYLDKLTYQIRPGATGDKLLLKVKESPNTKLKIAAHYDSENKAGINFNLTSRNLLFKYSRALLEFDFAENPRLDLNYLKYVGKRLNTAISTGLYLSRSEFPFFDASRQQALFNNSLKQYYVQFQSTNSNRYTIGARIYYQHNVFKPVVVSESLYGINKLINDGLAFKAFYERNTLNKRYYPDRGLHLKVQYSSNLNGTNRLDTVDPGTGEEISATSDADPFSSISVDAKYIIPVSPKISIITRNLIWMSNLTNTSLNFDDYIFVGGFNPRFVHTIEYLGGELYEFPTNNLFYSKIGIQYQFLPNSYLIVEGNYADSEYPMLWFNPDLSTIPLGTRTSRLGYGITLGYNSFIGPLEFSMGKDVYKDDYIFNLLLGFYF